jgi:acetyl-CoA carboxylase biotin carboxyl carrier protein
LRKIEMAKMEVESEVTGNVWKILVEEGSKVTSGDVVMILESMKMEIPVEASADGTIAELLVQEEDQVEEDQVVAVIDVN